MVIRNNQHGITMGKLCIMNLIVSAMRCLAWWMRGHSWMLFNSALVRLLTLSPITSSLTRWQSTCQIIEQEKCFEKQLNDWAQGAERRESSRGILSLNVNTWWTLGMKRREPDSSLEYPVTVEEATSTNWNTWHFIWTEEIIFFFLWKWSNTGVVFPERLWSIHPWRYSKLNCKWSWSSCSSLSCFSSGVGCFQEIGKSQWYFLYSKILAVYKCSKSHGTGSISRPTRFILTTTGTNVTGL